MTLAVTFAAKVDWWFLALFHGLGLFMLGLAPLLRARGRWVVVLLAVLGALFVGIGGSVDRVSYEITDDGHLDAHGWPWNGRITALSEIRSITPSRDPRASHAASLDRLRIDYGKGGMIFIAVEDEPAFLEAIAAADPGLRRTGDAVRRVDAVVGR